MTAATASPPPALAERAATLRGLGWTGLQAEWLALVCFHSGAFTRGQYAAHYQVSPSAAGRFVRSLFDTGMARDIPMPDRRTPEQICHVHSRALYRTLGIENNRHRRRASPDLLLRRLLSLDYILEHPDLPWLPTEPEKVAYFQRLGISLDTLPQRLYPSRSGPRPTRRFFPLKLPIAGTGALTTFVYADPGSRGVEPPIRHWARTHEHLWAALHAAGSAVRIVAVTRTQAAADASAAAIDAWRGEPAQAASLSPAEDELLLALRRARTTLDFAPLNRWGGSVAAAQAERAISERLSACSAPAGYIDSYAVHVADRLAPDPLAL